MKSGPSTYFAAGFGSNTSERAVAIEVWSLMGELVAILHRAVRTFAIVGWAYLPTVSIALLTGHCCIFVHRYLTVISFC